MSGGQQQRVALARALAPQPRLLLLDEPLSALDLKLRRGMQVELKRIQRETGITFVLVTHDQEEALSMSDRIAVMNQGRVLQLGRPDDIYERPVSRFVADFIGEANVLPGSLVGLPEAAFAAIRPERVGLSTDLTPGQPSLPGRVADVTYLGATTSYAIVLDAGPTIKAERRDLPGRLVAGPARALRVPARGSAGFGGLSLAIASRKRDGALLLAGPALLTIVAFMLLPMAIALVYSFMTPSPYGGVQHPFTAGPTSASSTIATSTTRWCSTPPTCRSSPARSSRPCLRPCSAC